MAQVTFASNATPPLTNLDANFTELYNLREKFKTPGYTGSSSAINIDANNNVGIGGDPSASWDSGYSVLQLAGAVSKYGTFSNQKASFARQYISWGVHATGADVWAYTNTGDAVCQLVQNAGQIAWRQAASGSAGGAVTWSTRWRIDANGNMILLPTATPPTLTTNGELVFTLTSNTNVRISARGSDGTTRVANITLA